MTVRKFVIGGLTVITSASLLVLGATPADAASGSSSTAKKAAKTAQERCGDKFLPGWSAPLRDAKGTARGDLNVLYDPNESTGNYRECRVITSRYKGSFRVTLKVVRDDGKVLVNTSGSRKTTFTSTGLHRFGYDFTITATVNPNGKPKKGKGALYTTNNAG